jgi:hypothetical protein
MIESESIQDLKDLKKLSDRSSQNICIILEMPESGIYHSYSNTFTVFIVAALQPCQLSVHNVHAFISRLQYQGF